MQCLFSEGCRLITASLHGNIVGQAFYCSFLLGENIARWVTQLVVHKSYRNMKIAQNLMCRCLGPTAIGIGLVSSNPLAVKALERAVGRRCESAFIQHSANTVLAQCGVPYQINCALADGALTVDTQFDVDHTNVNGVTQKLIAQGDWCLGELPDKHEFFAFIIRSNAI